MVRTSPSESGTAQGSCAEEVTYVELLRTTDALSRRLAELLKAEELSSNQYNVLRILRGAPEGLPCGEIGSRMITRDPDITRLLDRLEKRKLIARRRDPHDRRMVMARITQHGLDLLTRTDGPVREVHRAQLGHLKQERLCSLNDLLKLARERA